MPIHNVAVIFDNQVRPDTTGIYCRRALGNLVHVEHFLPSECHKIPYREFDFFLQIDDGLETHLPAHLRPCAWWAIDTHLNFDWYSKKAREFDHVFVAQRDGAEKLRQDGISSASWLPLACDPEFHRKHAVAKKLDLCFVGHLFPGPREELIGLLQRHWPDMFVGQRFFEEMAETYSASRIVFNRSIRNDINMRVFEAMACGSLLVTNNLRDNGQEELFRDGVHLATYENSVELLEKITFYLKREKLREEIAERGSAEARSQHTYQRRMERVLGEIGENLARTVVAINVEPGFSQSNGQNNTLATPTILDKQSGFANSPESSELLSLIPTSAEKVLDLTGQLKDILKTRQHAEVVSPTMPVLKLEGRLGDPLFEKEIPGSFDFVVCGDVLQHVIEPLQELRKIRSLLGPQGQLLASFGNVRYHRVLQALLNGHWPNHDAGQIANAGPLQFFTRREIEKLFFRAGFQLLDFQGSFDPEDKDSTVREGEVRIGRLHIDGLASNEAQDFKVSRFLVRAAPAPPADHGLTSIVMLTHNQLTYTRLCVDSIRKFTDEPYELIFVDNGSTDGTAAYLQTLAGAGAKVITNPENRGFPTASNQGIQVATGRQVLLLNNDTIVSTGWLHRLLRALHSDPKIGLAGPCSNCVSGEQQVAIGYQDLLGMDGFAWDWGKVHNQKLVETDRLIGFCLLIGREVIDRIGLLDERFGLGCFEDDDYCLRSLKAGFRAVIARDSFIHHFGGRTFVGSGIVYDELIRTNQKLFQDKWAAPLVHGNGKPEQRESVRLPSGFALRAIPGGGLGLIRKDIYLSLCMIVRDNSRTIRPCLESIRPWVDEMVVVDTGSKDETARIAEQLGAKVYKFPWCDSFSAARNESLRHAHGKWIFWMDSDDTIAEVNGRRLRELALANHEPSLLGFVMQVHCPGPGEEGQANVTVVDHLKLFRNLPQLRFEGRIHEQIIPAIRRAGGEIAWSDVFVLHSGYDHSPEGQEKKKHRDLHLLHLELQEQPEHPFTLFNLGMTYADINRHEEAVEYLKRSLGRSGEGDSHLRKVYALLTHSNHRLDRFTEAWESCREGLRLYPQDVELLFRKAILLHDSGRLAEAVEVYRVLLATDEETHFKSQVRGLKGYLTRQNLACLFSDMGNLPAAEKEWRLVVQEMPRYRSGWRGLGDVLLRQGKQQQAQAMVNRLLAEKPLRCEGLLLKSQVASLRGDIVGARQELEKATSELPGDHDVLDFWCRFLFEHGTPAETEKALLNLLKLGGEDGATHHNLGCIYMRLGRPPDAIASFRQSLQSRPNSPITHLNLGHALREDGQLDVAVAAWQTVLRLDPENREATELLEAHCPNALSRPRRSSNGSGRIPKREHSLQVGNRQVNVALAIRGPVDQSILQEVWARDVYGIRQLRKTPTIIVDIGAHIGIFSIMAAEIWPNARILACEPDPENCALLRENVAGRRNIEVIEAAILGQDVTEVNFNSVVNKAAHNSGGGSCVRDEPWTVKSRVPALSVGKLWQRKFLSSCDLLKLDCEGAEISILRAMAEARLLGNVHQVVGEWHASDEKDASREKIQLELRTILQPTHDVLFGPQKPGKEGHFSAVERSKS